MEMMNKLGFTLIKLLRIHVFIIAISLIGCAKPDVVAPPIVIPPAPVTTPSGEIQYFTINDTLVPFNTGSIIKWLVTETNSLTIVTYNGIKVLFKGDIDTGPLKQATKFTLAVNSGKQASASIKVADSLSTVMWNNGKRLKLKKKEVYMIPAGLKDPKWVDTTISIPPQVTDQRTYFNYDGSSRLIQLNPQLFPPLPLPGRFVTNPAMNTFTWQGITFTIDTLDGSMLAVMYDALQPNGSKLLTRSTYLYE